LKGPGPKDVNRLFDQVKLIDRALAEGVREALRQHKRAGTPVARWRDGKVVWVQPKDIKID
jgi:hypothetical protein